MDRGAWLSIAHGVTKSWIRLSDSHTHTRAHTHTHSCTQSYNLGDVMADGQKSLACCSPWGHKELDTTKQLN